MSFNRFSLEQRSVIHKDCFISCDNGIIDFESSPYMHSRSGAKRRRGTHLPLILFKPKCLCRTWWIFVSEMWDNNETQLVGWGADYLEEIFASNGNMFLIFNSVCKRKNDHKRHLNVIRYMPSYVKMSIWLLKITTSRWVI